MITHIRPEQLWMDPETRLERVKRAKTPAKPWRKCGAQLPDDEITVMGYFPGSDLPVWPVYHDDGRWRDAGTALALQRGPSHWCHMHEIPGPNAL